MKIVTTTLLAGILFITGCASTQKPDSIVGVWSRPKVSEDSFYFEKAAYHPDGRKCSVGLGIEEQALDYGFYISDWAMENGAINLKVRASSSEYVPPGYEIVDQLVELTPSKLVVRMIEPQPVGDGYESYERVGSLTPSQICDLAARLTRGD